LGAMALRQQRSRARLHICSTARRCSFRTALFGRRAGSPSLEMDRSSSPPLLSSRAGLSDRVSIPCEPGWPTGSIDRLLCGELVQLMSGTGMMPRAGCEGEPADVQVRHSRVVSVGALMVGCGPSSRRRRKLSLRGAVVRHWPTCRPGRRVGCSWPRALVKRPALKGASC